MARTKRLRSIFTPAMRPGKWLLSFSLIYLATTVVALEKTNDLNYSEADLPYSSVGITDTIGDFIWNDYDRDGIQDGYEKGIKDIIVGLYQKGPDGDFGTDDDVLIDYTTTDDDGQYLFTEVQSGEYAVKLYDFSFPASFVVCPKNAGNNDNKDSDFDPDTYMSEAFMFDNQVGMRAIDAGLMNPCAGFIPSLTIGNGQVVGTGEAPDELTVLAPNIAHPEDYEFQWMKKTAFSSWMPIPGANEMSYTPGGIFSDTYFVLCYRLAGCSSSDYKESNVIVIEVGNCVVPIVTPNNVEFCIDEAITFEAGSFSVNLSYEWDAEGGTISSSTDNTTTITWFEPGDYYVDLTATSPNGCEHTTRKLIHVRECNDYPCCANGQVLTTLCYSGGGTGSGTILCSVQVPCTITQDLLASGQYFCGPCTGSTSCGTGFFLSSIDYDSDLMSEMGLNESAELVASSEDDNDDAIEVEVETSTETEAAKAHLSVFPNPASTKITLSLDTKEFSNYGDVITVQLLDMQSRLHQTKVVGHTSDNEQLDFDLRNLPDGIYLLKIINGDDTPIAKKFVKMRP